MPSTTRWSETLDALRITGPEDPVMKDLDIQLFAEMGLQSWGMVRLILRRAEYAGIDLRPLYEDLARSHQERLSPWGIRVPSWDEVAPSRPEPTPTQR